MRGVRWKGNNTTKPRVRDGVAVAQLNLANLISDLYGTYCGSKEEFRRGVLGPVPFVTSRVIFLT